jgi:hypothetical protein
VPLWAPVQSLRRPRRRRGNPAARPKRRRRRLPTWGQPDRWDRWGRTGRWATAAASPVGRRRKTSARADRWVREGHLAQTRLWADRASQRSRPAPPSRQVRLPEAPRTRPTVERRAGTKSGAATSARTGGTGPSVSPSCRHRGLARRARARMIQAVSRPPAREWADGPRSRPRRRGGALRIRSGRRAQRALRGRGHGA